MSALKNKTILILSPQAWGTMFVSKHHYAVELAKYGNKVFFLNPPDAKLRKRIEIRPIQTSPDLFVISHRLNFPYNLKFHAIGIFHWLMKLQIKKILQSVGNKIDIVWSFDLGNLYPFKFFPQTALRIFHPVDEPMNTDAFHSANGAEIIFSVTNEILDKYNNLTVPLHFINHGVSEDFLNQSIKEQKSGNLRVGFSGNLLRNDIDRPVLLQIISENPQIVFECWGSYQSKDNNIGGVMTSEASLFISSLRNFPNVILHGAVNALSLAKDYQQMDAFLICYDIKKDQSKGTNYHKVIEFLSTGKVIVSNNISTYRNKPSLIEMVENRTNNDDLPRLFKKVMQHLSVYNSDKAQAERRKFAAENSYQMQLVTIEKLISIHCAERE